MRKNNILSYLYIGTIIVSMLYVGILRGGFNHSTYIGSLIIAILFSLGIIYFLRKSQALAVQNPINTQVLDDFSSFSGESNKNRSGITVLGVVLILGSVIVAFISGFIVLIYAYQYSTDEEWLGFVSQRERIVIFIIIILCILIFILAILSILLKIKILRNIHS